MDISERIKTIIQSVHKLEEACFPQFDFKIGYLTIFSKDENDYNSLLEKLETLGVKEAANNGFKFKLNKKLELEGETIESVRIRVPDLHRPEYGCADLVYKENEYRQLRRVAVIKGFDIIYRGDYEMIELSTLDINAYAYLVAEL